MEIRGAGPTYGATGPNMDPRTQAQYDVNALERYTQQFKDDLAALSKDPSNPQLKQAVQNDFKAMSNRWRFTKSSLHYYLKMFKS